MKIYSDNLQKLKTALREAEAVFVGAGSGLSAAAGFTYDGPRFEELFPDLIAAYHIADMYSGGFYPYQTPEEYWAWWSRYIACNRYVDIPKNTYSLLLKLVKDKDYFVLTTNVDHCFQKAGFDKQRLFYMQGDYGLFQCSKPCCQKTYDNETLVHQMVEQQKGRRIPTALLPKCPNCGAPMVPNLRADDTFVQDEGWYKAKERYDAFVNSHSTGKILYLELGVGYNTPVWIKYPFWQMTAQNPQAVYACLNYGEALAPKEIAAQSICIEADIHQALMDLQK